MAPTALRVRDFQPADQRSSQALILQGLVDHFGQLDATLNPDVEDIYASYIVPGHSFVVAELHGNLVATGALIALQNDCGRIARVSVDQAHRSSGIGRAVVTHLLQLARNKGYRCLLVETNHDWTAAIALYRRCGFEEYDRDAISLHMRLDLAAE